MKKILLATALLAGSLVHNSAQAQVRVNVSVNIGSQPTWGPVGYDYVQYYYLPDIDAYYYVPSHQFVYLNAGRWVFAASLPARYHGYNLYSGYKVVVNEPRPYLHPEVCRVKYARYKNYHSRQVIIHDSKDPKYVIVNKNNGHTYGHDKDKKHDDKHDKKK